MQGHSLRVGRYAAGIADSMGMGNSEISEMRAAGYLHNIGMVTVDKHLFTKPGALEPGEFQETLGPGVVKVQPASWDKNVFVRGNSIQGVVIS